MLRKCCEWWRLISSAVGIAAGFVMCLLFFCLWDNYSAGVWALTTGTFAAINFHLAFLHIRNSLETWHEIETLQGITLLGVLVSLAGSAGFIWYIFAALHYHIPLLPISGSSYISAVWAGLTLKFGLMLICSSRSYIHEIYRNTPPLIPS